MGGNRFSASAHLFVAYGSSVVQLPHDQSAEKTMADIRIGRELATVLAALRLWQRALMKDPAHVWHSEHFAGGITPLTAKEVDDLCERLNCGLPGRLPQRRSGGRPRG